MGCVRYVNNSVLENGPKEKAFARILLLECKSATLTLDSSMKCGLMTNKAANLTVAQAGLALAPRRDEMQGVRETLPHGLAPMNVADLAIAAGILLLDQGKQSMFECSLMNQVQARYANAPL